MNCQLSINSRQTEVSTSAELHEAWKLTSNEQFREVWLYANAGPALCALCNGEIGWLMYLREDGDAGFSSRNPRYEGDPDAKHDYRLDNGQVDSYAAAWALPESELLEALDYFLKCGDRSPSVCWHDDGG